MASAEKRLATFDAATTALWRVAESGEVEDLIALLPRVGSINARNEHGMTALMRAAQDGRVKMVRALLEHGADANIKRNDKFTALALAAFFGHTEVVRALMEHGADSRASTRGGTSPRMWATARTFNEVADQLEKPLPQPDRPQPLPPKPLSIVKPQPVGEQTQASPVASTTPIVVRTLKDPPEIWDLVHEAPRGFDPRKAFLSRWQSIRRGLAFRAATVVVLIAMCVVGVLVMRRVQARNDNNVAVEPVSRAPALITSQPTAPAPATVAPAEVATAPQVPTATTITSNTTPIAAAKFYSRPRVASAKRIERYNQSLGTNEVAQPVAAPPEKSEPPVRVEPAAKTKAKTPLSPELITPAKAVAPKAKVIQWP